MTSHLLGQVTEASSSEALVLRFARKNVKIRRGNKTVSKNGWSEQDTMILLREDTDCRFKVMLKRSTWDLVAESRQQRDLIVLCFRSFLALSLNSIMDPLLRTSKAGDQWKRARRSKAAFASLAHLFAPSCGPDPAWVRVMSEVATEHSLHWRLAQKVMASLLETPNPAGDEGPSSVEETPSTPSSSATDVAATSSSHPRPPRPRPLSRGSPARSGGSADLH